MENWVEQINEQNGIPSLWSGESVVLVAGGPSVTLKDIKLVNKLKKQKKIRVIGVNDAYRILDNMDILYAADANWYAHHFEAVMEKKIPLYMTTFWKRWADNINANSPYKMTYIPGKKTFNGLSWDQRYIHWGGNSGFQAFNVACLLGCKNIFMLGYDYGWVDGPEKKHWFGDHANTLVQTDEFRFLKWLDAYTSRRDHEEFKRRGINIFNCSLKSNLKAFPQMILSDALSSAEIV